VTRDELRALLVENGLARVANKLADLASPTVGISIRPADDESIRVGASKIGGGPDLPDGVEWPAWHEPMAFLGQFNLAEVARYERTGLLPRSGLLSFFYETDGEPLYSAGWGLPEKTDPRDFPEIDPSRGWRVLYHDADPRRFTRREAPPALNPRGRFSPCTVKHTEDVTLPDADDLAIRPLQLSRTERGTLIGMEFLINRSSGPLAYTRYVSPDGETSFWPLPEVAGASGWHLLGYPYNLDGPTLVAVDLEARGAGEDEQRAVYTTFERPYEVLAEVEKRWRLLLQVDSSEQSGMDWAGGGVLHFCIEHEALRRRDFSRVWLNLQLV
jgi:uncharacterized protein YwqG